MVVDRHVDPVPADAAVAARLGAPTQHAVPAAVTDAAQLLGVEVQQLARRGALVADDRWPRLEAVEPTQALPAQEGIHRRTRQAGLPGQAVRADPQLASQATQPLNELDRVRARLVAHHAATVDQTGRTLAPVAVPPLRAGLAADAGGMRGPAHRPAAHDALHQDCPASRRETGVSMWHEGPSFDDGFDANSRRIRALNPSTT